VESDYAEDELGMIVRHNGKKDDCELVAVKLTALKKLGQDLF
jgi:hypothetical protein